MCQTNWAENMKILLGTFLKTISAWIIIMVNLILIKGNTSIENLMVFCFLTNIFGTEMIVFIRSSPRHDICIKWLQRTVKGENYFLKFFLSIILICNFLLHPKMGDFLSSVNLFNSNTRTGEHKLCMTYLHITYYIHVPTL